MSERPAANGSWPPPIPGYTLAEPIGRGGFAWVYAAEAARTPAYPARPLCIKIAIPAAGGSRSITRGRPGGPRDVVGEDEEIARGLHQDTGSVRFGSVSPEDVQLVLREEASLLRRLDDPLFPTVVAAGEVQGSAYYVMERIAGETLRERLRRGQAAAGEVLARVLDLLTALASLRARHADFYHGDLKPENLVWTGAGLRLIDPALRPDPGRVLETTLTAAYNPLGRLGPGADTTALALVLFEAGTGRRPFEHLAAPAPRQRAGARLDPAAARTEREEFLDLGRFERFLREPLERQLLQWVREAPPGYGEMHDALARLARR